MALCAVVLACASWFMSIKSSLPDLNFKCLVYFFQWNDTVGYAVSEPLTTTDSSTRNPIEISENSTSPQSNLSTNLHHTKTTNIPFSIKNTLANNASHENDTDSFENFTLEISENSITSRSLNSISSTKSKKTKVSSLKSVWSKFTKKS